MQRDLLRLRYGVTVWLMAAACLAVPIEAYAQAGGAAVQATSLWGLVVDDRTGEPLPATQVRITELGRGELSHRSGDFHFERIAPGTYTVSAQRLGYAPLAQSVRLLAGDTTRVTLRLVPSAIEVAGVVVTGTARARQADETYRPTSVIDAAALRRQLGSSVAATIEGEPGISQRYNGPAAAQPVIRGLSGDRVLVLEDGNRTGDIASTGADHAVTIEPLTADRIEVVRGPAGLLYGSNALGGVINVIRQEVPRTIPEAVSGMASAQVESVNAGMTAGGALLGGVRRLVVRGELSGRRAGDTQTPQGPLPSTQMDGYNAGIGASWVHASGYAGAAVRDYSLSYGVPGTFQGVTIPGAHEGGVTIDLRRSTGRVEAAWLEPIGPIRAVVFDGTYIRFEQTEFEPGGFVGTRFGQLTGTGNLIVRHEHAIEDILTEGAFGAWMLGRDFSTSGTGSGSAPARQLAVAGFAYEELAWGPFRVEGGLRYDWTTLDPDRSAGGVLNDVRPREFGALSGSLAATADMGSGFLAGVSLARAFRTPSIEELYSAGPHLADYSFNIGNPDLNSEFGIGTDLFIRMTQPRLHAEATIFRNAIRNFIYYAPTGQLDPRLDRFPVFQATSDDAVLLGAEGKAQWEVLRSLVLTGHLSYVRGTRQGNDEPLPAMPPLSGGLEGRYEGRRYFAGLGLTGAGQQDRVPLAPLVDRGGNGAQTLRCTDGGGRALLECPTPGYGLLNATAGMRWTAWDRMHTLTLNANNLTDAIWRDHLSRIKEVAPQPGRNIQLLYRVEF